MANKLRQSTGKNPAELTTFNMTQEVTKIVDRNLEKLTKIAVKKGYAIPKKKQVLNAMLKKAGEILEKEFFVN